MSSLTTKCRDSLLAHMSFHLILPSISKARVEDQKLLVCVSIRHYVFAANSYLDNTRSMRGIQAMRNIEIIGAARSWNPFDNKDK
jgi:hypothetical protein